MNKTNCTVKNPFSHTKFDEVMSDTESIVFGLTHGSVLGLHTRYPIVARAKVSCIQVLGPLLFLIYINDIVHSSTQSECHFAYDTNIFITAKTKNKAYNVSNHVLRSTYTYKVENKLHINLFVYKIPYCRALGLAQLSAAECVS